MYGGWVIGVAVAVLSGLARATVTQGRSTPLYEAACRRLAVPVEQPARCLGLVHRRIPIDTLTNPNGPSGAGGGASR